MADRVLKLRRKALVTIDLWVVFCVLLILCAQLPLYIWASQDFRSDAFFWVSRIIEFWTAICGSVLVGSLLAFTLITKVQRARNASVETGKKSDFVGRRVDEIIIRIQKLTLWIVVFDALLILGFWGGLPSFQRTIYSDPRCFVDPSEVAFRFTVPIWYVLMMGALSFVVPGVAGKGNSDENCKYTSKVGGAPLVQSKLENSEANDNGDDDLHISEPMSLQVA